MKSITIKKLSITAFKGIKSLTLDLDGKSAMIAGRNGTGKTSVYDAFLWLLFGKDSAGAKPDVKPVDANGNRVSGVDCSVQATLTVDGKDVALRKDWHEVWRKPTSGGAEIYDRDETLCWINDVPSKIDKEFQPYVLSLIGDNENVFKLLTDHGAFMRLHWIDRRNELISISGVDPDAELQSRKEFKGIADILSGDTPDNAKKRLAEQRKRHTEQLNQIPARVDELEKTLTPVTDDEVKAAQATFQKLEADIAKIDAELNDTQGAVDAMNALLQEKREAEGKLAQLERDAANTKRKAESELLDQKSAVDSEKAALEREVKELRSALDSNPINDLEAKRQELLDRYHSLEAERYDEPEIDDTCPACGQTLPSDQIEAARQKYRDGWQKKHERDMAEVLNDGKHVKQTIATYQESAASSAKKIENDLSEISKLDEKAAALKAEYDRLHTAEQSLADNPEYIAATEALAAVNGKIEAFGTDDRRETLKQDKAKLQAALSAPAEVAGKAEMSKTVQARIDQLMEEKKRLGVQLAEIDGKIALLGKYVSARCSAMESAINGHFDTIRWVLFFTDKSGNIHDCCNATVNGVAYGEGLNNGACINAGIEIIKALSRAYGVTAPCFVDNAEAVNVVARTDGQMIELKVSDDETLVMTKFD